MYWKITTRLTSMATLASMEKMDRTLRFWINESSTTKGRMESMYRRESMVGVITTVLFELQSLVVPFAADTTWGSTGSHGEPHHTGLKATDLSSPSQVGTSRAHFKHS